MVGPATAIAESVSPHRLRKTNSPYFTRGVFKNDDADAQADVFIYSNINSSTNTPIGSRRSSFTFSNGALNFLGSTETTNRPAIEVTEKKVSRLIASFSNPSLFQGSIASLAVPSFRGDGILPRFGRSQSMVMDFLSTESTSSPSSSSSSSSSKTNAPTDTTDSSKDQSTISRESKNHLSSLKAESARENGASTIMSQSQPALFQFQIGPIARKNFREQTAAKEAAILRVSQLLVPDKSWVRAKQSDSGEAPSLDLDPFSPYSPGIHDLNLNAANTASKHESQNQLIDLNEFCKRVDILPKEEDDESDDDEEREEDERQEVVCLKEIQQVYVEEQSQESVEDRSEELGEEYREEYQCIRVSEYNDECLEEPQTQEEEEEAREEAVGEDYVGAAEISNQESIQESLPSIRAEPEITLTNYEIDFALDTSA
ncbi:hypothetical protein BGX26_011834 [Mortierella sp. AD094]|nr:hypothetical protein BGX26_011834 [Mortierella sp. AD094]